MTAPRCQWTAPRCQWTARRVRPVAGLTLFFFLLPVAFAQGAFAQDGNFKPQIPPELVDKKFAGGKHRKDRPKFMWWNDPAIVSDLSLSETQRSAMEAAWQSYEAAVEALPNPAELSKRFDSALAGGRWSEAENATQELAKATSERVSANGLLKVSVLKQLKAEQFTKLTGKYPRLVAQPSWRPRPAWAKR